ncbi:MAG: P-II family nitrogen regulator [Defluviimonas sp.]|uniref:P-II family nitrogen regulator n=1 Tax=Albidovulum sp. TaxID=1872424 RepID=UPI001E17AB73|nr:P-II family nitrogen regulator [Paracoccaceae bacterium]MCC0063226.1 P-II family nitrogen regulator [Defluviimonas sp.]
MRHIMAAIKPNTLEEVREALTAAGVRGCVVSEIKGFGTQSRHTEIYRGAEYAVSFVPKAKIESAVSDSIADDVIETVARVAKAGRIGEGKVFMRDLKDALRVRTGGSGENAP